MKKVFAFLSALVLTFACVGLALQPVQAAEPAPGMFIVDPTLGENDIPMYIMDSIKTTFPKYYDNDALPDPNWQGAARAYAWNEIKLKITQFDENGPTGKFYTPYFAGVDSSTNPDKSGAGEMIYAYADQAKLDEVIDGVDKGPANMGTVALTSLSYVRFNYQTADGKGGRIGQGSTTKITGVRNTPITIDLYTEEPVKPITYLVFDAEGRAVRGLTHGAFFQSENWTPLHGYAEDGSVVPVVDSQYTGIRRKMVEIIDEEGNPTGEFEDQGPDLITKKVLFQYFETEPTDQLNANGYLGEGWDPDKWDYYLPQYKVAILYTASDGKYGTIDEAEAKLAGKNVAVYNANDAKIAANGDFGAIAPSREATIAEYNAAVAAYNTAATAAGKETLETLPVKAGHVREAEAKATIPAGGIFYLFGYLDRGTGLMEKFNELYLQAFKYGREEGYKGEVKTYNFSAGAVKVKEYFTSTSAFVPLDDKGNKKYIEVLPGTTIVPSKNLDVTPMATYWGEPDKVWTFKNDTSVLQYQVQLNGVTEVLPFPYANKEEMVADFEKDFKAYMDANHPGKYFTVAQGLADINLYSYFYYSNATSNTFLLNATYRAKWAWAVNYALKIRAQEKGASAVTAFADWEKNGYSGSPSTLFAEFYNFLAGTHRTAWPATSDYTKEENAYGFLPEKSNEEEYNEFSIDTTGAQLNKNYVIKVDVTNTVTNSKSSVQITYRVVDAFTPILKLNQNAFFVNQGVLLDTTTLATATDGYGNSTMPYGNDISSDIDFVVEGPNGVIDITKPLPAGRFTVIMTVQNKGKVDKKYATLVVADTEAPKIATEDRIYVPYGGTWTVAMGIKYAVDNLDGDLLRHKIPGHNPIVLNSDPIDTTKPGQYNVQFDVYDSAGNKTSGQYRVIVADHDKDVLDQLDEVLDLVGDIHEQLLNEGGETGGEAGCQMPAQGAFVTFTSGLVLLASVAFLALRRKH